MVFSERYKDLVYKENGEWDDRITEFNDSSIKKKVIVLLVDFNEPLEIKVSRYKEEVIEKGAFECALEKENELIGYNLFNIDELSYDFNSDFYSNTLTQLYAGFTPHLFDVIEYQYELLSNEEKTEMTEELNSLLRKYDIPWLISDGKMIKIDSIQFEMDLKNKTAALMLELKDAEPVFQSAYDELNLSIEFFNKQNYSEAVHNAEKSYESVMKVFLNVMKGSADELTNSIINKIELPSSINRNGFKSMILMSLPFIRNNAVGHGAGASNVVISKEIANLSINLACSLITFVVSEYKKNGGISNAK